MTYYFQQCRGKHGCADSLKQAGLVLRGIDHLLESVGHSIVLILIFEEALH